MTDKCPFTLEEKNYEKPTKQPRIVPYLLKAEKNFNFFQNDPVKTASKCPYSEGQEKIKNSSAR